MRSKIFIISISEKSLVYHGFSWYDNFIMKKMTTACLSLILSLSLIPAQASFAAPGTDSQTEERAKDIPIPVFASPMEMDQAIARQIREAAHFLEEEALRQEKQLEQMREVLDAQQQALDARSDPDSPDTAFSLFPWETSMSSTGGEQTEEIAETETETEAETETETELPKETETEFHPVEMGAALPDTGEEEESALGGEETEAVETPPTEEGTGEAGDFVMVSRHGTFAVPKVDGLNEARISLYDYRMLREYPLPRLPKDLHALYRQLREQVAAYDGTWSVYVQNLTTGQTLIVNDRSMRSASVMKLFIMGAVYEAFDRGDIERGEDTVYLLRSMIINSSNEASNKLLIRLGDGDIAAGVARVNEFIRLRGFSDGTIEYNGFEDPNASLDPDHPNIIMAKDVGLLLSRVYNRSFISRRVCNEIEQMMLDQATRYKIPRGLPDWVECGNKSGETDTIANDAAVIYGPTTDYILVVLSNDWSNEDKANAQIAEISAAVYGFFEH